MTWALTDSYFRWNPFLSIKFEASGIRRTHPEGPYATHSLLDCGKFGRIYRRSPNRPSGIWITMDPGIDSVRSSKQFNTFVGRT